MNLDIYNTHMELYPYKKDDYPIIEDMYTATDKFTGNNFPCGYMIEDGKLYLPRGTSISKLEMIAETKANHIKESDPYSEMKRQHYSLYDPRNKIQEESIEFLTSEGKQLALNLKTGLGKAEPISTKIPTPTKQGWTRMGDIKAGDQVFGSDGEVINVIQVFPQGIKDIFKITLDNGKINLCSAEHLWQVQNINNKHIEIVSLVRLMRRHYKDYGIPVWYPKKKKYIYHRIKCIEYDHMEEAQCIMVDSEDHLYLTANNIITHNTFCVAYASTKLKLKTLIITPNESLKQQWLSTYHKMFDYKASELMNIAGSNIMNGIMEDLIEPAEVYFVNHQTLRSYLTSNNGYMLHKFFKKLNIGIKVYDESHMEFANILLMDFFSNTDRTWYLTATFDRSDKTESACFKRAFNSVSAYGEIQSAEVIKKHIIYHVVNINSRISPKDRAKVISYTGMTAASYGRYAFLVDQNDTAYKTILDILNKLTDVEGKILIFIPLIEAVDEVVKKLKKDYPQKSVAAFHSKVPADEKRSAEKKDIIVSTVKSFGTGKDIPGLRVVICAEPIASKVVTEQLIGRLRPYEDKDTYFFDIIDVSLPHCNYWFRARFKKIETLVKDVIYLNV